jgi:hypothetical protein
MSTQLFTRNSDLLDPLFSIKKKVHQLIIIIINAIYLRYLILCYTNLFSELSRESHGRAFREGDFI